MSSSDAQSDPVELERTLVVKNKMGIHARPAAMIVRTTNKYDVEVSVEKDDGQVNGRSIMGLMMLAAGQGSKLRFTVKGRKSEELLNELGVLFERQFEEA